MPCSLTADVLALMPCTLDWENRKPGTAGVKSKKLYPLQVRFGIVTLEIVNI